MKNKKALRILSVCLAAAVVICGVIGVVYASSDVSKKQTDQASSETLKSEIADTVRLNTDPDGSDKEETVYVVSDACGGIQNIIVSEWLRNPRAQDAIEDYTELSDIKNTNGDETFSSEGGNRYIWKAAGHDIHYQGNTKKQLPVTVSVSYQLDGKDISPAELAGRSGHVSIRFNYTNNQKTSAQIDGKQEDIFVPFLMVSGLILDNSAFSNVKVTNGTVYNDGSRNIVLGYALPGLSESLDISDEDFEIPDYVQIDADTTAFSLDATLTVGMTNLFSNIDIDTDGGIDALNDSLDDLEDAALQLIDGASNLYSGASLLYDSCGDLKNGVGSLLSGAKELDDGAGQVNAGASSLRDGLGTLSKNSPSLNAGAKEIVNAVFASATSQLREKLVSGGLMTQAQADAVTLTPSGYVAVFQQLSGAVTITPAQVEAKLRASLSAMTTAQQDLTLTIAFNMMAADSNLSCNDAVTQAAGLMQDAGTAQSAFVVLSDSTWLTAYDSLITYVSGSAGVDIPTAQKIVAIAYALSSSDPSSKIQDASSILSHASTVLGTTADSSKITSLCTAVASAATSTGNASLDAVKKQLDDVMAFYNGLLSYTAGVDSAYSGSKSLAQGTSDLKNGVVTLVNGVTELYAGSTKLYSGAGDLKDGTLALKNGVRDFYDKGVKKLVDSLNGDFKTLFDRLKAIADAGRSYQSFAGIADGMTGTVKFIYRTDAVTK